MWGRRGVREQIRRDRLMLANIECIKKEERNNGHCEINKIHHIEDTTPRVLPVSCVHWWWWAQSWALSHHPQESIRKLKTIDFPGQDSFGPKFLLKFNNIIISGGLSRHSLNYIVMSLVLVLWSPGHNGWDGCNSGQATTILLIMQSSYSLYWTGIHIWLLCLLLLYSPQSVHYNIHTEPSYYKCPYACPRWPFIYVQGWRKTVGEYRSWTYSN